MEKKILDKLNELWAEYWNWIMKLPDAIGVMLTFATVVIPIIILGFGLIGMLDWHFKTKCLDSQLARRWSPTTKTCEEYHNGAWVETTLLKETVYYYNGVASREH